MSERKAEETIDTRTLEGLLDDLKEAHERLGQELRGLANSPRLSEPYHEHLAEIDVLMTWLEGLAPDIKAEIDRVDDQLPDD
jgi:hypothetical protein